MTEKKIGFIGQGWIGRNYADNFESRGFEVVRYSKDKEYVGNKDNLNSCRIIFVAVPTPTIDAKFDGSILKDAISVTKPGDTVIIKSTLIPEFTRELLNIYPDRFILISPEFLSESTARYDTDNPSRNIIGVPDINNAEWMEKAKEVMEILPKANVHMFCTYEEASLIKYAGNCFLYVKNMFFNMLYDLVNAYECNWEEVRQGVINDPRIGDAYTNIFHKEGRGAGGHCLPKDFVAFRKMYFKHVGTDDIDGCNILIQNENKNKKLLKKSKKDINILNEVYGKGSE